VNLNIYCGGGGGGRVIGCYVRFASDPVTKGCILQFIVNLHFSFPPYCPA
jgi:hypothetical protein